MNLETVILAVQEEFVMWIRRGAHMMVSALPLHKKLPWTCLISA